MANLPVPSSSSAPAAVLRPAANGAARGKTANDPAAAADENPFQAVLALELGLAAGLPGQSVPSTASEGGIERDQGVEHAADDTPLLPGFVGVMPFAPPSAKVSQMPAQTVCADTGRPIIGFDPRQMPLHQAPAVASTESPRPTGSSAADIAVPGKFAPAAAAEIRHEVSFDASLLETNQPAPVAFAPMHAETAAPAQTAPTSNAPPVALEARVGDRGWDQALGDKLVWLAGQSRQVAQLHLNPPELGPLQITLTIDNDQASAQFVSAHALVRDAIEAAMPRLREMLAEGGIALGNASVSAEAFREQAQPQQERRAYVPQGAAETDAGEGLRGMRTLPLSRGLVDTFA